MRLRSLRCVDGPSLQTKLDEVDPRELAKQLTLLLAKEFARLRPREYAHFLRTKTSLFDLIYNHKLHDARVQRKMGHLAAIISSFCGLVHWLRREINESVGPRRAKTLIHIFRFAWVRLFFFLFFFFCRRPSRSAVELTQRFRTRTHRSCFVCGTCTPWAPWYWCSRRTSMTCSRC